MTTTEELCWMQKTNAGSSSGSSSSKSSEKPSLFLSLSLKANIRIIYSAIRRFVRWFAVHSHAEREKEKSIGRENPKSNDDVTKSMKSLREEFLNFSCQSGARELVLVCRDLFSLLLMQKPNATTPYGAGLHALHLSSGSGSSSSSTWKVRCVFQSFGRGRLSKSGLQIFCRIRVSN